MSDLFFHDLRMPRPDHSLGVGAGSHAEQTARVMERFDPVLVAERPDWVVVVGDVNSTLAASLVAAKRRPHLGCRIAHVEAGLRSGDWSMPEEVNRVLTDQMSDLLLTHSPEARSILLREGVRTERVVEVGNVMIDSLFATLALADGYTPWEQFGLRRGGYGIVTLHRPSNVDTPEQLTCLVHSLEVVAESLPLLWPVHPRTRRMLDQLRGNTGARLKFIEPVGYRDMAGLVDGSRIVLTDSGGLQEESTALGVPCVTLRESTERPITVSEGSNRLAPWPLTTEGILRAAHEALTMGRQPGSRSGRPYGWDGRAAVRVVQALEQGKTTDARCALPRSITGREFTYEVSL
jgi:UDP-N-acetylglucosamine 2-epimerase (non-hydrolysing)